MEPLSKALLIQLLALMVTVFLPSNGSGAESGKSAQPSSAIDFSLPIHQRPKLNPEFADPVLGDQAQIAEWAWSPQYAERFGLKVQPDGLPNGGLWLVGVKITRKQDQQWQRYTCDIVGVIQNDLPILTPPGDIYTPSPFYQWSGTLPPPGHFVNDGRKFETYTPFQAAWFKTPKNKLVQTRPERSITLQYLLYYRHLQNDLAYFEIETGCGYFNDPKNFRNEIGFPNKNVVNKRRGEHHMPATSVNDYEWFGLPDAMMSRIYPYIRDAEDWSSCIMHRVGGKPYLLTTRVLESKRFGNICEQASKHKQ